jgi:hypothetical protein
MIGAGVFSAFAAAAAAAGAGLVIGLGIAAVVAFCNATASAQLAATCPTSVVGEEVRDPPRTIPRAITLALGIAVAVYAVVGVAVLATLGSTRLASSAAPLVDAVRAGAWDWAVPVVTIGGATAALGALLALIAGVGRTTLAMARNGDLPRSLASVHPRYRVPHRAEIALAAVVSVLVLTVDLRRGDRVLVVRRAAVLPDRRSLGVHPAPRSAPLPPVAAGARCRRLCPARRDAALDVRFWPGSRCSPSALPTGQGGCAEPLAPERGVAGCRGGCSFGHGPVRPRALRSAWCSGVGLVHPAGDDEPGGGGERRHRPDGGRHVEGVGKQACR